MKFARLAAHALIAIAACAAFAIADYHSVLRAQDCARRYVASGDHYPAGHDIETAERFPNHLLDDYLKKWGPWCLYNVAKDETTSAKIISDGQLAQTWNYRPDLITLRDAE